jgi:hypothetical protein
VCCGCFEIENNNKIVYWLLLAKEKAANKENKDIETKEVGPHG